MFEDEAGFGRINKPKTCWCPKGKRPAVPCHHIREYRYAFGAVEPLTGENFFLSMPYCNTNCTNTFLAELSKQYPDDLCTFSKLKEFGINAVRGPRTVNQEFISVINKENSRN